MTNAERLAKTIQRKKEARETARKLAREIRELEVATENERLQTVGGLIDSLVGEKAPTERSKLIKMLRASLIRADGEDPQAALSL